MSDLERMLAEWLEYLDDEEGDMPLPEWAGETGWIQGDNGILEDWGIYLLRLAHDEIAALKRENEALREIAGATEFSDFDRCPLCYGGKELKTGTHTTECKYTLLTAEEQASVLRRPYTQLAGTRKPMIGGTEITAEEQEDA